MDYQKLYCALMSKRKDDKLLDCYKEEHHILPKSLGGSDDKYNLVFLTAKEHYVAHHLLCKFLNGNALIKMQFAFWHLVQISKRNK